MSRLLLAGCGDLGRRLAGRLGDGHEVHGLRRRTERLDAGIRPLRADLGDPASLEAAAGEWDAVVYTATPAERTEEAYRATYVEGLENLLRRVDAGRLVYVSSTAVYGQDEGQRVDEDSPTEPSAFNGRILLEGERRAIEAGGVVVRFAGIYGPGRDYLLRKLRRGPVQCRRHPPVWTNRIHADDCAAVLEHLLGLEDPAPVWVASDGHPAPRWEVLDWLARRIGAPGPVEPDDAPGAEGQGKRVEAARLLATGLALQYPDYRAGYAALLHRGEP
ncbi:MAG: SDR family oxidoreductase [Wenzhouxiangellaceae bacterium]|nr:SDR family oxidoreductase [Wenzhouxiangellaceae bacterium]